MASRTVAWSVLSSLGIERMYCLLPTRRREKPEPRGSRDLTARRMSSLQNSKNVRCFLVRDAGGGGGMGSLSNF